MKREVEADRRTGGVLQLLPVVPRDRLINDLLDPLHRLIVLLAPAGYGKSMLARALSERANVSATVDLAFVQSPVDLARLLVEALSVNSSQAERERVAEQSVMFGADSAAWQSFATDRLRSSELDLLIFENAESAVDDSTVLHAIEGLLRDAPGRIRAVVCSRVPLDLHLEPFACASDTRIVGSDELRFNPDDVAEIFATMALSAEDLNKIERFACGWPIVVMMLYAIARRGRLAFFLEQQHDDGDRYGYLATEVFNFLDDDQRAVLEAAAAIPEARESDIAALFDGDDWLSLVHSLARDTPFLTHAAGRIEVHPAMRQMLARRSDQDHILGKLYAAVDRADGGVRAAQIALHRRRPHDAAAAIIDSAGAYFLQVPKPEVNQILGALPDDVLYRYPLLWGAAALTRSARDIAGYIASGEKLFASFTAATPLETRLGVFSSLVNSLMNRGRLADATTLITRFRALEPGHALVEMVAGFWTTAIGAYKGQVLDRQRFESDYAPLLAQTGTRALCDYDIIARDYRLHGNRSQERATLERAVSLADSSGIPIIIAVCVSDAACGAWLWGDAALFDDYVSRLRELSSNAVVGFGMRHFLDCVSGRGAEARLGSEKLKTRAFGFLIAAALKKNDSDRIGLTRQAVLAADQSSQPYMKVLTRVVLAFVDAAGRDGHLAEAEAFARETCSVELQQAVSTIRNGKPVGEMFAALAERFGAV